MVSSNLTETGVVVDLVADGHYLNLPVMSEAGEIVGMVDVLKLTYATLDQVRDMQAWSFLPVANYFSDQQHEHW
jgi:hypothetical protein